MTLRRRGLTLAELVLALGLLSLLMLFLFQLIDRTLSLWDRAEARREFSDEASGIAELFVSDLSALESGPRGDFLADWVLDGEPGDEFSSRLVPRLRMVCVRPGRGSATRAGSRPSLELCEVAWTVVPAARGALDPSLRAEGVILRGERTLSGEDRSFFDPAFAFPRDGETAAGLSEVRRGCLWFGFQFASQTSVVNDGWSLGAELEDCAASWDGWGRSRPDASAHAWNEPAAGMPRPRGSLLLPRRVLFEIELEDADERKRRTVLSRDLSAEENVLVVADAERLPRENARFLLVDWEWMEVLEVRGDGATVRRGARGSRAAAHQRGAMVHHGLRFVREVPMALYREDWNL